MGMFSAIANNPYVKWGVAPGALGALGGVGYGAYMRNQDGSTTGYGTYASMGALGGLALASPMGVTSRARRDYKMYSATSKSLGYGAGSTTGFSKAMGYYG